MKRTVVKFILAAVVLLAGFVWTQMPRGTDLADSIRQLTSRWTAKPIIDTSLTVLRLTISNADFHTIEKTRVGAIKSGVLGPKDKKYVSAILEENGTKTGVQVRLKGMESDHWQGPLHWSFKVKSDGTNGWWNFGLMHPDRRYGMSEALFHFLLKNNNANYLRYEFVNLFVNNKSYGIYAREEGFGGDLHCKPSREDGVVFKLNFDSYIQSGDYRHQDSLRSVLINYRMNLTSDHLFNTLPIKVFQPIHMDPIAFDEVKRQAIVLFQSYLNGETDFDESFDISNLMAALDVMSWSRNYHPLELHNLRFYYSPTNGKIELIPYDLEGIETSDTHHIQKSMFHNDLWGRVMLEGSIYFPDTNSEALRRFRTNLPLSMVADFDKVFAGFKP